jgi:hypothetical protein
MAGVRGHEVPICEPRGLPDDTTLLTRYSADLWAKDGHSHSFLGASEIKELEAWVCEIDGCLWPKPSFGYLFDNSWGSFIECPEGNPDGLEDIRFVFWFCN